MASSSISSDEAKKVAHRKAQREYQQRQKEKLEELNRLRDEKTEGSEVCSQGNENYRELYDELKSRFDGLERKLQRLLDQQAKDRDERMVDEEVARVDVESKIQSLRKELNFHKDTTRTNFEHSKSLVDPLIRRVDGISYDLYDEEGWSKFFGQK